MLGLDVNEVAGLRADVARYDRLPPSPVYQDMWDKIEEAREIKKLELGDGMKKWAGFVRASWFAYRRRGNIPLDVFARLLTRLGLKYRLEVVPAKGYVKRRSGGHQEVVMNDDTEEARQAADAINAITDPGFRAKLANKVLAEAIKYKHRAIPLEPPKPAEQTTE